MPARPAARRLVVSCFARVDEGLIDEWPVTAKVAAIRAAVPATVDDPDFEAIHTIEAGVVEALVGHAVGPFAEEVDFYLELALTK